MITHVPAMCSLVGNFVVLDKNPRFSRIQIRSLLFKFLSSLEKKPLIALFGGMGKNPHYSIQPRIKKIYCLQYAYFFIDKITKGLTNSANPLFLFGTWDEN